MGRYLWNPYIEDSSAAEAAAEQAYLTVVEDDRLNAEASEVFDAQ